MSLTPLPLTTRLWFALACFFRVLFDGAFAALVKRATSLPELPSPDESEREAKARGADRQAEVEPKGDADRPKSKRGRARSGGGPRASEGTDAEGSSTTSAAARPTAAEAKAVSRHADPTAGDPLVRPLQLLALLQREGRLVDFLQQDITSFDDADVGAAARVVHEGCRKALWSHATIVPVRTEAEESTVRIEPGYDSSAVKLTGAVGAEPPYRGVLRHRGWRVEELRLPEPLEGHDFHVVAPAEVEL